MAGPLILMLGIAEEDDRRRVPRNRLSNFRSPAFDLREREFISHFRLNRSSAFRLIEELKPYLEPKTLRKSALNTEIKVLCALNFFAHGGYQKKVANDINILLSQTSVSKCIKQVSQAMSRYLLPRYIKFPDDEGSQMALKHGFHEYCGIGGVVGAIDCTHVAIIAPPDDGYHMEKNYVNRKGWHSLNVQLVCDMNMLILNVVARFPGCSHDAYIWHSSSLKRSFMSGNKIQGDGWLLGDSGYPYEVHLHTPYSESLVARFGPPALQYNIAHSRGRCVVERCNGMLKNRFRCLLRHRTLHYRPETAARITNSCTILHNLCIMENLEWEQFDLPEEDQLFDT